MYRHRLLLASLAATTLIVLAGSIVVDVRGRDAPPHRGVRREVAAAAILQAWDSGRARAWAAGDPVALGAIYTSASQTGRADQRMLRAWVRRGLRVEELRMQLLGVRVRSWSPDRLVLDVTDRLAGGTAVGGGVHVPLPHDQPTSRVVELRRVSGQWRVARVSDRSGG